METIENILEIILEFMNVLKGPAEYSFLKSLIYGTGLFLVSLGFYIPAWVSTKSRIIITGYPDVREKVMYDYEKEFSWIDRIFLTRLKREAKARKHSVRFYWLFSILIWICALGSTVTWIGTLVMRNSAWLWLEGRILLSFAMIGVIGLFLPEWVFAYQQISKKKK